MSYRILDVELSKPLAAVELAGHESGYGLVARWGGDIIGFLMRDAPAGSCVKPDALRRIVERELVVRIVAAKLQTPVLGQWPEFEPGPSPTLTIAICTKDRPANLARLLDSIAALPGESGFRSVEVLVVDNASSGPETRRVVESRGATRYRFEPKAGLDFARNTAIEAAAGDLIAYLDDDVVVDRGWLSGLYRAWQECPDAAGYTGLILPYRLDTPAQILFERQGGFGRGFRRLHQKEAQFGNPLHPVGAGVVGAGANMCFCRNLLRELGGFDEALDTGTPLPGGGDLDIFYRVLRRGYTIVYDPGYAVFHEHRETMKQLRRQYWSWGLGFMAFLDKAQRSDAALHQRHAAMRRWWFRDKLIATAGSLAAMDLTRTRNLIAELGGGLQGSFGEYQRSTRRSDRIRRQVG